MQQLKCSRWTMLPTSCVARSYLSFSGAFTALVYSPHAFGEIGVIGGDRLRDRAAQQREILGRRGRRQRGFLERIVIEPGRAADVARLVHAFQPEAALVPLPREERPARQQRRRTAAPLDPLRAPAWRRDELDFRSEE